MQHVYRLDCTFAKYIREAYRVPGAGLIAAEERKRQTYDATVDTVAFGTFGRLGAAGLRVLKDIARAAAAAKGP